MNMSIFNQDYCNYLTEADRQLKEDRNKQYNSKDNLRGRTTMTSASDDVKLSNLSHAVNDAMKAKDNRTRKPDYRNHTARLTADTQVKRLKQEGMSDDKIKSAIDRGRRWRQEDRDELAAYRREKAASRNNIHDKINAREKKNLKEACEYILSVLEESEYIDNDFYDDEY